MKNEDTLSSFSESQRFNQLWLWVLLTASALLPLLLEWLTTLKTHNPDFVAAGSASVGVLVLTILILRVFHLKTSVNELGVSYQLFPVHTRMVQANWDVLEKVYVRKYKPLKEFGGWGMRISFRNGTAYNISGNMGLQLIFKDGKKILVGTQKPEQLRQLLEQFAQQGIITQDMITPAEKIK